MKPATEHARNELYNAAIDAIDRGWSIFPLSVETKKPLNSWKEFQNRQPTYEEVDDWFENGAPTSYGGRVSNFNLAVVTGAQSGIVIVDADNQGAVDHCKQVGLTSPWSVETRRGRHYYFKHPGPHARASNKAGMGSVSGLDFRGDGGYAVMPPSVSVSQEKGNFQYKWEVHTDFDDVPTWQRADLVEVNQGSIEDGVLPSLAQYDAKGEQDFMSAWERAEAHCQAHGLLGDGDGRNNWLVRYAGEQVRKAVQGEQLIQVCRQFCETFFAEALSETEFATTLRSAQEMDRRNHPEDYDEDGNRKMPEGFSKPGLTPVFVDDLEDIERSLSCQRPLIDPWLNPASIVQVYGYAGHGKSLFVQSALWNLAIGQDFGPFKVERPARVLYFDWENGAATLHQRMVQMRDSFGHPGQNYGLWAPPFLDPSEQSFFTLADKGGRGRFLEWCDAVQPEVVVIDTIRSAFAPLDENEATAWALLNDTVIKLRNLGLAVVLMHHANKPTKDGLGREAGSSNQLTALEQQVRVTQVFKDEETAEAKGGIHDHDKWLSLASDLGPSEQLRTLLRISYGKVRDETPNHVTTHVGFGTADGGAKHRIVVDRVIPRMEAINLSRTGTMSLSEIAMRVKAPANQVKRWLEDHWHGPS